jgi:hypothetical protein
MSYGLDSQGSIPNRTEDFSLLHSVQTSSETHPVSCLMGNGGSFLWVKQPKHESDHSLPSAAKLKNGGINFNPHPSLQYIFMAWCSIN